jgi:hypothetical protein
MEATIYLLLEGSACIANLLPDGPAADSLSPKTPLTPVFKPRIVELSILSNRRRVAKYGLREEIQTP